MSLYHYNRHYVLMPKALFRMMINVILSCGNDGELFPFFFVVWNSFTPLIIFLMCSWALLQKAGRVSSHQGDKVSEGQLDLNFHFVFRMNHRTNILVVVFEQVANQL